MKEVRADFNVEGTNEQTKRVWMYSDVKDTSVAVTGITSGEIRTVDRVTSLKIHKKTHLLTDLIKSIGK